jgi:hypothetical protein
VNWSKKWSASALLTIIIGARNVAA